MPAQLTTDGPTKPSQLPFATMAYGSPVWFHLMQAIAIAIAFGRVTQNTSCAAKIEPGEIDRKADSGHGQFPKAEGPQKVRMNRYQTDTLISDITGRRRTKPAVASSACMNTACV